MLPRCTRGVRAFVVGWLCVTTGLATAQTVRPESPFAPLSDAGTATPPADPGAFRTRLDAQHLEHLLLPAPTEGQYPVRESPAVIEFPNPDGLFERFAFVESSNMQPALQARFPEIRSYLGQGLDNPAATVRFDVSPWGFHAQVLEPGWESGAWYIDPARTGDATIHVSHGRTSIKERADWACETPQPADTIDLDLSVTKRGGSPVLRTEFLVAISATGEFSQLVASEWNPPQTPSVALTLAAINTTMNRINQLLERDGPIRLVLVASNDQVIYVDPATDPYTSDPNAAMSVLQTENQANLDNVIGIGNYSLGHLFHARPGAFSGNAGGIGTVCVGGLNARGVSIVGTVIDNSNPLQPNGIDDWFAIDLVAHEIGHQLGATHTFNGVYGSCGNAGQYTAASAYEPGSGSSIMSYGGICGADDVVTGGPPGGAVDAMYSFISMLQFATTVTAAPCAFQVPTSNTYPDGAAAQGPYYLPTATPFKLVATQGVPEIGESLTYSIEQADLGARTALANADTGVHEPLFRVREPTVDEERFFPPYAAAINGVATLGEVLPRYDRSSVFKAVVRDNVAGAGGWSISDIQVEFVAVPQLSSGFRISEPAGGEAFCGGELIGVIWNVAGTNDTPFDAGLVDILMSTDNGDTFPWALAVEFPNVGAALVPLPFVPTTTARIMVRPAVGNNSLFYAVNPAPFEVATAAPTIAGQPTSVSVCPTQPFTLSVTPGGGSPRHYQWYKDGAPLASATNATYHIDSATNVMSGEYHVVVSNGCGEVVSNTVRVQVGVTFDSVPASLTPQPCDTVAFEVVARGVGPLSYQWYKDTELLSDGDHISGVSSPVLVLDGARYEDEGYYACLVSDACETRIAGPVTITLPTPTWAHITSSGPVRRLAYTTDMAYDPVRGVAVLYGGFGPSDYLGDTWEWDGVEWMQRFPAHTPARRSQHELVFDSTRGTTLLFGGYSTVSGNNAEVWEYDGNDWTLLTTSPGGPSPLPGQQGDAAYDPVRGKMIVLTEDVYGPIPTNRTWEFDSTTLTWQITQPSGEGPVPYSSAIVFDPAIGYTIAHLYATVAQWYNTYLYNGTLWTPVSNAGTPQRYWPVMAYDAVRARPTIYGCCRNIGSPSAYRTDTYAFQNNVWVQVLPDIHPTQFDAEVPAAMTFDTRRRAMTFVGNTYNNSVGQNPLDTWEYRYRDRVVIDRQPASTDASPGEDVTLRVFADGAPNLTYQWYFGGVPLADGPRPDGSVISGATQAALTIQTVGTANGGEYLVEIINGCGTQLSDSIALRVLRSGDCGGDGIVGFADFAVLIDCLNGPAQPDAPGCACVDIDIDGDNDLRDFAEFQLNFGAP